MKKSLIIFCLFFIAQFIFASDVSDLLQAAQSAYESGDVTTAIKNLDSAKSIMEKEQLSSAVNDYIELSSWDIVKFKQSEYDGKKVKVKAQYLDPNANGTVYLVGIGGFCTYDESLIDKLLSLQKYKEYIFYGTVFIKYSNPYLHIEGIE